MAHCSYFNRQILIRKVKASARELGVQIRQPLECRTRAICEKSSTSCVVITSPRNRSLDSARLRKPPVTVTGSDRSSVTVRIY